MSHTVLYINITYKAHLMFKQKYTTHLISTLHSSPPIFSIYCNAQPSPNESRQPVPLKCLMSSEPHGLCGRPLNLLWQLSKILLPRDWGGITPCLWMAGATSLVNTVLFHWLHAPSCCQSECHRMAIRKAGISIVFSFSLTRCRGYLRLKNMPKFSVFQMNEDTFRQSSG